MNTGLPYSIKGGGRVLAPPCGGELERGPLALLKRHSDHLCDRGSFLHDLIVPEPENTKSLALQPGASLDIVCLLL